MSLITVQIESKFKLPSNIIYTNASTVKKLNLPLNNSFSLSFGNKHVDVFIELDQSKGNLIRIPDFIARLLHLQDGVQIHAKYNKKNELCLGPILGVLVQSIQNKEPKNPFGKFTVFAHEVNEKAHKKGVYPYFFTFDGIDFHNEHIKGWTLINNKWVSKIFPIPNVIYNRISSRKLERKLLPQIKTFQLKYKFIFFNNNFLNKWEVYQILKNTSIKNIMPKTILFSGSKSIKAMLNYYTSIYLKPTDGALGRGIIKIEKKQKNYIVQSCHAQGAVVKNFSNFNNMYKYLLPRISSKKYLVQQGLVLLNYQNRPIDFRILVQKNSYGIWSVSSMVARIAKDQSIVSNLAQGGTQSRVMNTINLADPILAKKITKNQFRKTALTIAKNLESTSSAHFAEFGIDLGLDNVGKLWLLEVNSKPSKIDEQKSNNESRPSVSQLINYVFYVTNYNYNKIFNNNKKTSSKNK